MMSPVQIKKDSSPVNPRWASLETKNCIPLISQKIKEILENNSGPLTPRKTTQIDQLARSPDSPRDPPTSAASGLTPRKEKRPIERPLDLD